MAKISITIEGSTVGAITVADTLTQEHSGIFANIEARERDVAVPPMASETKIA